MAHLVIGTRGDALAVRQASFIKAQIERTQPGLQVGLELLANDEPDWLNEASAALLSRRVDAIVHHLCDLSPRLPEDIHLAVVVERADARDALLVSEALRPTVHALADLPAQARVFAQGAPRRAQIAAINPQVLFSGESDSLELALRKLTTGECDAVVADTLSLRLLQADNPITAELDPAVIIPTTGQGALALQSRIEDQRTNLILESLNHTATRYAVNAERAALRNLYGEPGDAIAITATQSTVNGLPQLTLIGMIADSEAEPIKIIRATVSGEPHAHDLLGSALAVQLLNEGGRDVLARTRLTQKVTAQAEELHQLFPWSFSTAITDAVAPPDASTWAVTTASQPQATSAFSGAGTWGTSSAASLSNLSHLTAFHETAAPEFDLVASKVQKLRQHQPLHGRRLLLAAANRNNDELIQTLEGLGATVSTLPRMRMVEPSSWEALDKVLLHISWYDWLIFASAASVTACLNRCASLGHHVQEIEARRLCAVGKATAAALRAAELAPDLVLPHFDAATLATEWETRFGQREALRGRTMLLLTEQSLVNEFTQINRSPLRVALDQLGVYVEAVTTHQQTLKETKHSWQTAYDYALFFDPSSFETLTAFCAPRPLHDVLATSRILTLSQETHKIAQAYGLPSPLRLTQTHPPALVKWLREDALRSQH